MKTINEQREEIIQVAKNAIYATSLVNDGYIDRGVEVEDAAENIADNLIKKGYRAIFFTNKPVAFKEGYECGRADESNTAKNEISAYRDELRRVSEDSKERDNENLRMQSAIDDISEENNRLREAIEDFTVKKCGLRCEIVKTLIKEFAEKLKTKIGDIGVYAFTKEDIDELLKEYEK